MDRDPRPRIYNPGPGIWDIRPMTQDPEPRFQDLRLRTQDVESKIEKSGPRTQIEDLRSVTKVKILYSHYLDISCPNYFCCIELFTTN